jgi:outer membrane biosynthesis protein TonB
MGIGVFISFFLHLGLVAIAYFGIPSLRQGVIMEAPIMVEILNVAEVTNTPKKQVKPEKKAKLERPKPKPKPEPPKPVAKAAPEPKPEPVPAPEPEEVAIVPPPSEAKPKPKVKAKEKPKPEPKPVVKEKPKAPAALARVKPKHKPKPPDVFASVMKTVADLNKQPAPSEPEKPKKKKPEPKSSFQEQITKALGTKQRSFDHSRAISISEIDYVRQQITKCWSPPAGAKDARNMIIEIAVSMNSDGTVRDAVINNTGLQTDTFLRAMAESALRAVLNRHCQPFKLPRDKFDRWKTMKLVFNPKEMLGG